MNTTSSAELATFTTDFGVTFGHFVCFDIVFKSPAVDLVRKKNVSHILFPSMWFSETPFYGSAQYPASWAYSNNVVLLASGANSPTTGNTGSGIFIGKYGAPELIVSPQEIRFVFSIPIQLSKDEIT